jgi:hypothetical protein
VFHLPPEIGRFVMVTSGRCVNTVRRTWANGGSGPWAYLKYSWIDCLAPLPESSTLNESGSCASIQVLGSRRQTPSKMHGVVARNDGWNVERIPVTGESRREHASAPPSFSLCDSWPCSWSPSLLQLSDVSCTPRPCHPPRDVRSARDSPDVLPETTHLASQPPKMHVLNI